MEERYIAAVDLGTSKLAVCVARILNNNIEVIYYKETPSVGVSYSYVINPGKVQQALRVAISEAQQALKITIRQVIVGLPRWHVRQEMATAKIIRENPDGLIQESEIRDLKTQSLDSYPIESKKDVIYGAVAQSFSTEDCLNEPEYDIVGMASESLEGNFKVFIGSRRYSSNIDSVFGSLGIAVAKKYFTPGITARAVLKQEQMENGVALFDLGAGVSSVTIFKNKIMRFYAAIPFGGNNVTKDIRSECNFPIGLAENIKVAYGACMPDKLASLGEKILQIMDEEGKPTAQVPVKYISEIITARMKEIIEALLYKIQESGYASESELREGVVVTGGGADLVNCANYIKELSGYSVKIGKPRHFFTCEGNEEANGVSAATTMGMILSAKGDRFLNCVDDADRTAGKRLATAQVQKPTAAADPATDSSSARDTEKSAKETVGTERPENSEDTNRKFTEESETDRAEIAKPVPVRTETETQKETGTQNEDEYSETKPEIYGSYTQDKKGKETNNSKGNTEKEKTGERDEEKKDHKEPKVVWIKRIFTNLYNNMTEEEV